MEIEPSMEPLLCAHPIGDAAAKVSDVVTQGLSHVYKFGEGIQERLHSFRQDIREHISNVKQDILNWIAQEGI
jgi:hypothetical protein